MSKSRTATFNCRVILGATTYKAGDPVPIGTGKTSLSEEEARRLHDAFGHGRKSTAATPAPADPKLEGQIAELNQALAQAIAEKAAAIANAAELEQQLAELTASLEQAEADNGHLASRIAELEAAAANQS